MQKNEHDANIALQPKPALAITKSTPTARQALAALDAAVELAILATIRKERAQRFLAA